MSESARLNGFLALVHTRLLEAVREPEVIFWSFVFPIILSAGLAIAFRNRPPEASVVALVDGATTGAIETSLKSAPFVQVTKTSEEEAQRALRLGKVDILVRLKTEAAEYQYDPSRPESLLARSRVDDALQRAAGRKDIVPAKDRTVVETGGRYIDFLIPGIIGMNLMAGGMWGVGFNLVDMRIKRLLKRFLATPMRRSDFMLATMTVRILSMFVEVTFLLIFGRLSFGFLVRGAYASVFLVALLGALSFSGLGLLVASRARRIESVMGLMNVIMMPMWVCSGVFFSSERFPHAVQPLIRALPLTALNDALRGVILEGTALTAQAPHLGILLAWGGLSFVLALRFFRWS